jgi:hypothetical protein
MKRRLFNLVAALSLLLCVAFSILWVRSHVYTEVDSALWGRENGRVLQVWTSAGQAEFCIYLTGPWPHPSVRQWERSGDLYLHWVPIPDRTRPVFFYSFKSEGFPFITNASTRRLDPMNDDQIIARGPAVSIITSRVPLWILVGITAAFPAIELLLLPNALRRRGRRKQGLRLTCGYDLRATVDRCPECGTAID